MVPACNFVVPASAASHVRHPPSSVASQHLCTACPTASNLPVSVSRPRWQGRRRSSPLPAGSLRAFRFASPASPAAPSPWHASLVSTRWSVLGGASLWRKLCAGGGGNSHWWLPQRLQSVHVEVSSQSCTTALGPPKTHPPSRHRLPHWETCQRVAQRSALERSAVALEPPRPATPTSTRSRQLRRWPASCRTQAAKHGALIEQRRW